MPIETKLSYMWNNQKSATTYRSGEKLTAPHAKHFIEQSGVATRTERPLVILDNACGTGVISSLLHRILDEDTRSNWELTCGDSSEAMVSITKDRIEEEGWNNAEAKVVDAQQTGLPSTHYTHIFIGMGK